MKKHRKLIQEGRFYRLLSPFDGNYCAWMAVSEDKSSAIFAYYRILAEPNPAHRRVKLVGLDSDMIYGIEDREYYGSELMNIGIEISAKPDPSRRPEGDYYSRIIVMEGIQS